MRTIPDEAAIEGGGVAGVATLLARWQADRDLDDFTALVANVHGPIVRMAARTLRRAGIRDPGARDDVMALVLEQLFRLGAGGARPPPAFDCARVGPGATVDPGWVYVRCVTRSRARDVARAIRRRERLHAAVATLDERSRELVTLLLDGKSQVVIAHVLGVCEGTVSRIRTRAIARLRTALINQRRGQGFSSDECKATPR